MVDKIAFLCYNLGVCYLNIGYDGKGNFVKKSKRNSRWVLPRHRRVTRIVDFLLRGYTTHKYGIEVQDFAGDKTRPYLILMNHQTAFDQFFLGMAFKGVAVYYVASEDIFSLGIASKLIRYLVNPIPIKKQSTDARAVINCIKVAKEGGNIAMAPEGNRTYSGKTGYFNPTIAPLARKLGLPIALFRIEGGYGVHPRWSDVIRKGKMRAYVSEVIEPEQYATLTDRELCHGLYVDEAKLDGEDRHKRAAEYLERAIYVCPQCGFSTFHSEGDELKCEKCGLTVRYLPTKELASLDKDFSFKFLFDWYEYQQNYLNGTDIRSLADEPVYTDIADAFAVVPYKKKKKIDSGVTIRLFGDRVELCGKELNCVLPFSEASAFSVLGKNKLNIYFKENVYQIKGDKRFCALKYLNLYHRYKNIVGGNDNGFLGI